MNAPAFTTKPQLPDIKALTEQYVAAKAHLKTAQQICSEAESALIAAIGHKDEGSLTIHVDDKWKVTTTGKINRTVSGQIWDEVKGKIPAPLANRLVRFKPEVNLKELRYVELNEPEWFAIIAPAITAKPAKPALEVKEV